MDSNVPEAEHCPETESNAPVKVVPYAISPGKIISLSDTEETVEHGKQLVKENLVDVEHKILILSGKGGVGKSTVTALLGRWFALKAENQFVGILDLDICGPSQPRLLGVLGKQVYELDSGWTPVCIQENFIVISMAFLLKSPDEAVIWRGPKKNHLVRQFLSEVEWDFIDYLLIDTPSGSSDEHLSVTMYLEDINLSGAIIVTTPQEVALLDARKEIDFCRKMSVNILGVIENMASFVCPCCNIATEIFPAKTGGTKQMCLEMEVPYLGSLPLDPNIAKCCDEGKDIFTDLPNSRYIDSLKRIGDKIMNICPCVDDGCDDSDDDDDNDDDDGADLHFVITEDNDE